MSIKHARDVEEVQVSNGVKTTKQVLISSEEGPNFAMRRFIMEAGGGMPRHTNTVEHEQYVLNGKARVGIDDEVFEVKKGDVVFIPGNVPHWYQNIGDDKFEFLCIVPNKPDKTTILSDELPC
ncbi:MAG: cupin domain-containing protein [Chloroflexi bacterium]|nr:cupin domain-containing protein [Chloroflexota bacterium]